MLGRWLLIAVTALLLGYQLFLAVSNALVFPQYAADFGLSVNAVGWFWLVAQVALPLALAVTAVLLSRKRPPWVLPLALLTALALASVAAMSVSYFIPTTSFLT